MSGATTAMARRSTQFQPSREPLANESALQLQTEKTSGPLGYFNPTRARYTVVTRPEQSKAVDLDDDGKEPESGTPADGADPNLPSNVEYKYSKRDSRKGRHALVVRPAANGEQPLITPPPTASFHHVVGGIWRMFSYFPVWDVSWLVAVTFTLGSVVWVINGFFAFLPFPTKEEFEGQVLYGGGITAFIGATIFEIGSAFLMLEAVNENRTGCFGWAVEHLGDDSDNESGPTTQLVPSKENCSHHHQNVNNVVGKQALVRRQTYPTEIDASTPERAKSWVWWPSANELRTHYLHDLGFMACLIQAIAATVFWISGFTALPGIYNHMSKGLTDGIYWTPQVIGASGFVISGFLFMLETQKRWWMPAMGTLGWHIGFWNFIGGVGFLLCPCFGYSSAYWAQYQASLSSFWGSWSFLIGSTLQWYESLEKHPVEVEKQRQE